jgi:antitoxin MazE
MRCRAEQGAVSLVVAGSKDSPVTMYIQESVCGCRSLTIRLPATVVEALELKDGDQIEIRIAGKREFEARRDRRREDAIERLRRLRRPLLAGFTFDRTLRMSDKVFFDTTILIYAISERDARTSTAKRLLVGHLPIQSALAYTYVYANGMPEVNLCRKPPKSS